jgi:exodeoxyribonuclease V alpha subunit
VSSPPTTTSAWATFRHLDRGDPWTRADRMNRELAQLHDPAQVHLARELAYLEPDLTSDERLASELLFLTLLLDVEGGSTRMPFDDASLLQKFRNLFHGADASGEEIRCGDLAQIAVNLVDRNQLSGLIGRASDDGHPYVIRGDYLHESRLLDRETQLAYAISRRPRTPLDSPVDVRSIAITGFDLTEEQRSAVHCALSSLLTLVSGGPGTGKTSIVVAIITAALKAGIDAERIVLAAPTGKAAWRMGESIRSGVRSLDEENRPDGLPADAQTLHRLLGYSPTHGSFKRHHAHPLKTDLLIVDEASMIDTVLMERLLAATPPNARLVLLGDAEQLPSVRAGAVFRSLTRACGDRSVQLTRNFRMRPEDPAGAEILKVAQAIKMGTPINESELSASGSIPALRWRGVERIAMDDSNMKAFADHWYARTMTTPVPLDDETLPDALNEMESARLLCVTRNGPTGVNRWNERLHAQHARRLGASAHEVFLNGEPVMILRNDYGRGLFNGDQGLVFDRVIDGQVTPSVAFRHEDGFRFFALAGIRDHLEHCYAMTVHKSQGSEFESVAIQLPERDSSILTRELIYTAVTRSRRTVVFIGSATRLNAAIERPVARSSALVELVAEMEASTDA